MATDPRRALSHIRNSLCAIPETIGDTEILRRLEVQQLSIVRLLGGFPTLAPRNWTAPLKGGDELLAWERLCEAESAEDVTILPAAEYAEGTTPRRGGGTVYLGPPGSAGRWKDLTLKVVDAIAARGDADTPATKLPSLKPWAMQAWKLGQLGMTYTAIAAKLAEEHEDPSITQPRVSEQIPRAQLHAEASGLAGDAARVLPHGGSRAPGRTLDPSAAERGKRTDGKAHHLRERERQKARDNDDDNDGD